MPNIENKCTNPGSWEWGDKYPEHLDPDKQPDEFGRLAAHLGACPFHAKWEARLDDGIRTLVGLFTTSEMHEMLDQMAEEHPEHAPKIAALKDILNETSERAQAEGLADLRRRMAEATVALETLPDGAVESPPPDEDEEDGLAEQLWREDQ